RECRERHAAADRRLHHDLLYSSRRQFDADLRVRGFSHKCARIGIWLGRGRWPAGDRLHRPHDPVETEGLGPHGSLRLPCNRSFDCGRLGHSAWSRRQAKGTFPACPTDRLTCRPRACWLLAAPEDVMAVQPDRMRDAIGTVLADTSDPAPGSNLEPRLPYDDLRQWLEQARKLGEVKDVSGLSWQEDIGIVAGVAMHDDGAPCFVFDAVPGTIEGSRVLVNFFGGKRKNMTLGFPTELSKLELSEGFRTSFLGTMPRIAPRYVSDGPIFENVMTGEEVDVTRFPAPKWHAGDGGRYIGT